jgi:hypothetical protein
MLKLILSFGFSGTTVLSDVLVLSFILYFVQDIPFYFILPFTCYVVT